MHIMKFNETENFFEGKLFSIFTFHLHTKKYTAINSIIPSKGIILFMNIYISQKAQKFPFKFGKTKFLDTKKERKFASHIG